MCCSSVQCSTLCYKGLLKVFITAMMNIPCALEHQKLAVSCVKDVLINEAENLMMSYEDIGLEREFASSWEI